MAVDMEARWRKFQARLGYSDEELARFRQNPKWVKMVEETPEFMTHRIIAEVVSSHGCHAQHKVGDKFVMDGNGQLITAECPQRMCVMALAPLVPAIYAIYERFAAKLDANGMLFDRVSCMDVGPECGGWGRILMRVYVEPKRKP